MTGVFWAIYFFLYKTLSVMYESFPKLIIRKW